MQDPSQGRYIPEAKPQLTLSQLRGVGRRDSLPSAGAGSSDRTWSPKGFPRRELSPGAGLARSTRGGEQRARLSPRSPSPGQDVPHGQTCRGVRGAHSGPREGLRPGEGCPPSRVRSPPASPRCLRSEPRAQRAALPGQGARRRLRLPSGRKRPSSPRPCRRGASEATLSGRGGTRTPRLRWLGGNRRSPKFPRALTGGAHGAPQARSRASPRPLRHGASEGRGEGAHCSPTPPTSRRRSQSRSSSPRPPPPHPTPRHHRSAFRHRPLAPPTGAHCWALVSPRPRCLPATPPPHQPRPQCARKRALAMLSGSCSSPRRQVAPSGAGPGGRRHGGLGFPACPREGGGMAGKDDTGVRRRSGV